MKQNLRCLLYNKVLLTAMLLHLPFCYYLLPSLQGGAGSGSCFAQNEQGDVTLTVTPVQSVLPPQAGKYVDNLGRYFNVTVINNTDVQQNLYFGVQIQQKFPNDVLWMSTDVETMHMPHNPIVLSPNQHKTLNSIELKHLFDHYDSHDIFIREGRYKNILDSEFGLLDEGQYELQLTAYKWDVTLSTPVVMNNQTDGVALFNICYEAEPPVFLNPIRATEPDGLSNLAVTKIDKNQAQIKFDWTQPTLNCNATMVQFRYRIRFVELGSMMPDEAMEENTITFLEKKELLTPTYTIPTPYVNQMIADTAAYGKIYAMQVTAYTPYQSQNSLNVTMIKNEGKSDIFLFQLYDPTQESEDIAAEAEDDDANAKIGPLYTFEQPTLTSPQFPSNMGRYVFLGDSIKVEWRKAWFAGGKGERQDTVKFEYTVNLYTGNSADSRETIIKTAKPFYSKTTKDLSHIIYWDSIKTKPNTGDYCLVRVTAKPTNKPDSIFQMQGDSLNIKDFAFTNHFDETYQCGSNTAVVENKTIITEKPEAGTRYKIGQWNLELIDEPSRPLEYDKDNHTLTGFGRVEWSCMQPKAYIAVKFEGLKVNTDGIVFDGVCKTYAKSSQKIDGTEFTDEQIVDSLFSSASLDNIFGALSVPEDVRDRVTGYAEGQATSLAKSYNLGKYYTQYKKAENTWENWQKGDLGDLYFPFEAPDEIKKYLPKDFSLQIGNMTFSPSYAVMNLIGAITLPNSDVWEDQDVLVFGAPRLCISPDRFFPEDGVLALLSNFVISDPSSDFKLVFKAPSDPLNPVSKDGCFIKWENDEFEALGLEIAMTIPNTKRVVDGKPKDDVPALLDLWTVIAAGSESSCDFIAEGTMTPFQVNDLPDWTFTVGNQVVFDHHLEQNGKNMPDMNTVMKWTSDAYDLKQVTCYSSWDAWQGVFIDKISVQFPKWAVLGNGDEGVEIGGQQMLFDASGATGQFFAKNLLDAETGRCGGWKFSIDEANVQIVQNNFDHCTFKGGIGVPLLGKVSQEKAGDEAAKKDGSKDSGKGGSKGSTDKKDGDKGKEEDKPQETDIEYFCQIRNLTDPELTDTIYTYEKDRNTGEDKKIKHVRRKYHEDKARYGYVFSTDNADKAKLGLNFFLADLTLLPGQTYFLVEAVDSVIDGKDDQYTQVELCLAGDITIAGIDGNKSEDEQSDFAKRVKEINDALQLPLKMPGIHFAKMRLSNKALDQWKNLGIDPLNHHQQGIAAQEAWEKENKKLYEFTAGKEIEISEDCYFNYGEWSLASDRKKIGPFSFNLEKFEPSMVGDSLRLDIKGDIGLVEDKICVGAGVVISANLHKEGSISEWYISDGDVAFRSLKLDLDFTALHLKGELEIGDDGEGNDGYAGSLDIDVTGLFSLNCAGGYFNHRATDAEKDQIKKVADEEAKAHVEQAKKNGKGSTDYNYYYNQYLNTDTVYSWGYFTISVASEAGIRFDPIVINRISGGFYFSCKPQAANGASKDSPDKLAAKPKPYYGMIGIAFGMGMSTSAGEKTLSADVDLLVVYDRKNSCLSTFKFDGNVQALGGMINSDVRLVYENSKDGAGNTLERYLCLNITVEAGWDASKISDAVNELNASLESIKDKLDEFQSEVDGIMKKVESSPLQNLASFSGDYDPEKTAKEEAKKTDAEKKKEEKEEEKKEEQLGTFGKVEVPLELKITWKERNLPEYDTPKWHLYVGEPSKDKRCHFTYLKFDSKVCSADIGADAYLCLGNELPGNGQLPEIPSKITEFLNGHKQAGTDMGADMTKLENSRKRAASRMLNPNSLTGGVMVGASAWGNISIDLGLIYGSLDALAGFDAALINYGDNAVCMNTFSSMGKNGWYAMGQLYAYLAADLGIRIKIGSLINENVTLINAGIGGVLEMGLPNPSWVEGQARVKMSFLGGLFSINKKFEFAAGDHCVPFKGNALDGFEMFQNVNLGSDSLYEAWYKPEFAISASDVSRMTFTTNTSIGSHYRLVDPSYAGDMGKELYEDFSGTAEELDSLKNLAGMMASRTYVFDIDQNTNEHDMKMGVRLFDLGDITTWLKLAGDDGNMSEEDFYKALGAVDWNDVLKPQGREGGLNVGDGLYGTFLQYIASACQKRENTVCETSWAMWGRDHSNTRKGNAPLHKSVTGSFDEVISTNNLYDNSSFGYTALKNTYKKEVDVSFREDKGTFFHLNNIKVEPGNCYVLVLSADAYEIENGERVWAAYVNTDGGKEDPEYIKWRQSKLWFFRVKRKSEDTVIGDSLRHIEPYVALAYPSVDGTKVTSGSEGYTTAYINDIMHPTIALNRDLSTSLPKDKMKWVLTAYKASEYNPEDSTIWREVQTRDVKYVTGNNCVNLEPTTAFNRISKFTAGASKENYDFSDELYHLQLTYTYHHVTWKDATHMQVVSEKPDSTRCLVDLWLTAAPHDVTVKGMSGKQDDSWKSTTNAAITGEILPYSLPFVGARPTASPTINAHNSDDMQYVYRNASDNGTPWRLMDPYLYMAYLSKFTFIGDRTFKKYGFDDAYIPFASESLTFERNGTVVNSNFIKDEEMDLNYSKSIWNLRNEMYDTWNTWYYNHPESTVEWPLPSLAKTAGGLTIANQDLKVSTVTPLNLMLIGDRKEMRLAELLADFAAPYYVAEVLNNKLRTLAGELWSRFTKSLTFDSNGIPTKFDSDGLNEKVKLWNSLHRGQYVEVGHRGVTVRVPYYQLPLIFGGCFAGPKMPTPRYKGLTLSSGDRGFTSSIGSGEWKDNVFNGKESRWAVYHSNLLFFRLLGSDYTTGATRPEVFARDGWDECFPYPMDSDRKMEIQHDNFQRKPALAGVTKFKAITYRVDAFDLTTGEYKLLNRGGGPYKEEIEIGSGKDIANLSELDDLVFEGSLTTSVYLESEQMQAIYTADNKTMTIVFSNLRYQKGNTLNGHSITNIWNGSDFDKLAWRGESGISGELETVVFDKTLANAKLTSTANWFNGCRKLKTLKDLKNLKMTNVTDMSDMFAYCESMTSFDFSDLDTRNVTNMSGMLRGCNVNQYRRFKGLNTSKVTDMSFMFADCPEVSIPKDFDTHNVTTMESMFENCGGLYIDLSYLNTAKVKNMRRMFYGNPSWILDLNSFTAESVTNTEEMFANTSFRTLKLENFHANKKVTKYENMFAGMNTTNLYNIIIAWDLKQEIKDQLPTTPTETTPPVQLLHVMNDANQEQLLFLISNTEYKAGYKGNVVGTNTYKNVTVKSVWGATDMQNYASYPAWNSVAANVKRIIIDPSFTWSPKTMQYWFSGFSNVTAIDGLNNLNTKKVQQMNHMFASCSSLTSLDLSSFNTEAVTRMDHMFDGCKALKVITVGNQFTTQNVQDMSYMFNDCANFQMMTTSDNSFAMLDTRSAQKMAGMFKGCETLDEWLSEAVTHFQTDNVDDMREMFQTCSSVKELDLTGFDTKLVKCMDRMLNDCKAVTLINLASFKTPSLTSAWEFGPSVTQIVKRPGQTQSSGVVQQLAAGDIVHTGSSATIYVPYDISKLIYPDQLGKTDIYPNVKVLYPAKVLLVGNDASELIFTNTTTSYKVGDSYYGKPIKQMWADMNLMFSGNPTWVQQKTITTVTFEPSFVQVYPTSLEAWFKGLDKLKTINGIEYLSTSSVKTMAQMFAGCSSLTEIDLSHFACGKVTDMSEMFSGCSSLRTINLSDLDSRVLTTTASMFKDCSQLSEVKMDNFKAQKLTDISDMFNGCTSLMSLDFSSLKTSDIVTLRYGSSSIANLTNMERTFNRCERLSKLTIGNEVNLSSVASCSAFNRVADLMVVVKSESKRESIRNIFVNKLGFEEGTTGYFYGLSSDDDAAVPQVIWTEGNTTLTFFYGKEHPAGSTFHGQTVTTAWTGDDVTNAPATSKAAGWWAPWTETVHNLVTDVVIDPSFAEVRPKSTAGWFDVMAKVKEIVGLKYLNTSEVEYMMGMFYGCNELRTLDLSNFNTAKVKRMDFMFGSHYYLTELDLSSFVTDNVENMKNMFYRLVALEKLDISNFNTEKVTNADYMLYSSPKEIIVGPSFILSSMATKAKNAFMSTYKNGVCINTKGANRIRINLVKSSLINGLGFDETKNGAIYEDSQMTAQAIWTSDNTTLTFYYGRPMKQGDTFNGKTVTQVWSGTDVTATPVIDEKTPWTDVVSAKVTTVVFDKSFAEVRPKSLACWFAYDVGLTSIEDIAYLNTSEATTMYGMFGFCMKLSTIDVTHFDTGNVEDMSRMFWYDAQLTALDVSQFNTSKVTSFLSMFTGLTALKELNVSGFNTGNAVDMAGMFHNCKSLTSLDVSRFNTAKVTSMANMFEGCENLTSIFASNFDTGNVTQFDYMFSNCSSCSVIDVSKFNTANATSFASMFSDCTNLQEVDISGFKTSSATRMDYMFLNCKNLTKVTNSTNVYDNLHFDGTNLTNIGHMFEGCSSYKQSLNLYITPSTKLSSMNSVFKGCGINWIVLFFDTSNVTDVRSLFQDCQNLLSVTVTDKFSMEKVKTYNTNVFTGAGTSVNQFIIHIPMTNSDYYVEQLRKIGFTSSIGSIQKYK